MTDSTPTVQEAWASVMGAVRGLRKGDRNQQQGFNFRGVDAVMNAVGPALREHGVTVAPVGITDMHTTTYTTRSGTVMRDVQLVVQYAITGPAGDTMPGAAAGEASDAGDKATPKAMSVAYRTFLLQALCLPTDEPDPDHAVYERGPEPAQETPLQTAQRGIAQAPSLAVLDQVMAWAQQQGLHEQVLREQAEAKRAELERAA